MMALFWVELHAVDVPAAHAGAELQTVGGVGCSIGRVSAFEVEGVQKIEAGTGLQAAEQSLSRRRLHIVPAHVWHWQVGV